VISNFETIFDKPGRNLKSQFRVRISPLLLQETVSYGDKSGSSDSELFSTAYHKLVHSGIALDTMLQVEQSYAHDVVNMIQQRDDQIEKLTKQ
jgi:Uncharacterized conserved protein (DUF2362).